MGQRWSNVGQPRSKRGPTAVNAGQGSGDIIADITKFVIGLTSHVWFGSGADVIDDVMGDITDYWHARGV